MDPSNRIQHLSMVPTQPRQTPKRDFGDELAHIVGNGARLGVGLMGGVVGAPPVVSAAVSAAAGVMQSVGGRAATVSAGAPATLGSQPAGESSLGGTNAADTLSRQAELNRESQAFTAMYLQLQSEMQAESRQYNAVSNVIKVRHESARSAINNIR